MKNFFIIICFFIIAGCASESKVRKQKVYCGVFEKAEKCEIRKVAAEKKYQKALKDKKKTEISKKTDIDKFKKDQQAEIDKIAEAGPSIDFVNEKKPRRALSKNQIVVNGEYKSLSPNNEISINFKGTELVKALTALGSLGNKNVIISEKVTGFLTLNVKNAPWNEVFNSVVEMNDLVVIGNENSSVLKIYSSSEGMGNSNELVTEVFNIFYETPTVIAKQLIPFFADEAATDDVEAVEAILTEANDENKTLVVKGTVKQINKIEELLNTLDVKKPQILIEAFLVEVTPSFTSKLGTRLGLGQTKTRQSSDGKEQIVNTRGVLRSSTIDPTSPGAVGDELKVGENNNSVTNFLVSGTSGLGIIAKTSTQQLKFEIDALETEGVTKTLSNPKLFTVSGKNAVISQGQQISVAETKTVDGTTSTVNTIYNASLMLNITPTITGDGTVELKMLITNDTITSTVAPITITTKSVDTNVVLNDGDIAVVGGILTTLRSKNTSRVPGLGKIPFIGTLFRSNSKVDDNVELLIFIAPRIV